MDNVFLRIWHSFRLLYSKDDSYYERPTWLEEPIYEVLKRKSNFTMYLQAVDKTLYSRVLKGASFYTVLALNDDAFLRFLSENKYSSVDDVPVSELTKIGGIHGPLSI